MTTVNPGLLVKKTKEPSFSSKSTAAPLWTIIVSTVGLVVFNVVPYTKPDLIPFVYNVVLVFNLGLIVLAIYLDSVRKHQVNKIEQSSNELNILNEELTTLNYMASHDLMEPLRLVNVQVSLLEAELDRNFLTESQIKTLSKIGQSSLRATRLVKDLMLYTKLAKEALVVELVDIDKSLQDAISVNSELVVAVKEGHAIIQRVGIHGAKVRGDNTKITLMFQNLIQNAWKYRIKSIQTILTLTVTQTSSTVFIRIADNGQGMTLEQMGKAGEPFKRFNKSEVQGSGVGLAICKRLACKMGGRMELAKNVPNGLAVTLELPKFL